MVLTLSRGRLARRHYCRRLTAAGANAVRATIQNPSCNAPQCKWLPHFCCSLDASLVNIGAESGDAQRADRVFTPPFRTVMANRWFSVVSGMPSGPFLVLQLASKNHSMSMAQRSGGQQNSQLMQ